MNIKMVGLAALVGAVVAGGCKQEREEAKAEDVMAVSVNGEKLMKSSIDADVAAIVKAQGSKIPAEQLDYAKQMMANQVVQSFIISKVLVEKAKKEGFTITDADRKTREEEFLKATAKMPDAPKSIAEYFKKFPLGEARAREEFESGILIDKMIKAEQAKSPKKDHTAEAQKIIDGVVSNNATAKTSEEECVKKIRALKAELDKVPAADLAKKFAELAKENSGCPSKDKGGDLGVFTHGQMVKEFDEVAFKLPEGKVSDPVKTQFGYHLVMVTKKFPAVEASGDKPAQPEKVQASHILIKAEQQVRDVPKMEDVVKFLERQDERAFTQEFIQKQLKGAKIEASEEYKQFLPQPEPPKPAAAKTAEVKSAEKKADAKTAPAEKAKAEPVAKPAAK